MMSVSHEYPLLVIAGPTASGKSALALGLAEQLRGEIVNYDSVQIYRGLVVGAGKLPLPDRRGIPHHLLDCREPEEIFTAGDFRREALAVLAGIRERGRLPILVGGTGLYLRALLQGLFEGPARSEELRARLRVLAEQRGREHLHRLLRRLDAVAAARLQPRDAQKTIRALEVRLLARRPISAMHASGRLGLEGFRVHKIGLDPERARLYGRIDRRVESMFAQGLLEETRALLARGQAAEPKVLGALGYRQAWAALRGECSLGDAIRDTQAATRRYAKRQMTWFRREPDMYWYQGFGDDPEIQRRVLGSLELSGAASLQAATGS